MEIRWRRVSRIAASTTLLEDDVGLDKQVRKVLCTFECRTTRFNHRNKTSCQSVLFIFDSCTGRIWLLCWDQLLPIVRIIQPDVFDDPQTLQDKFTSWWRTNFCSASVAVVVWTMRSTFGAQCSCARRKDALTCSHICDPNRTHWKPFALVCLKH